MAPLSKIEEQVCPGFTLAGSQKAGLQAKGRQGKNSQGRVPHQKRNKLVAYEAQVETNGKEI